MNIEIGTYLLKLKSPNTYSNTFLYLNYVLEHVLDGHGRILIYQYKQWWNQNKKVGEAEE